MTSTWMARSHRWVERRPFLVFVEMPFVTAGSSSSTALILLLHKGISALRHAQPVKIAVDSG